MNVYNRAHLFHWTKTPGAHEKYERERERYVMYIRIRIICVEPVAQLFPLILSAQKCFFIVMPCLHVYIYIYICLFNVVFHECTGSSYSDRSKSPWLRRRSVAQVATLTFDRCVRQQQRGILSSWSPAGLCMYRTSLAMNHVLRHGNRHIT